MDTRCASVLLGLMVYPALLAQAHDFWLQPTQFEVDPEQMIAMTLQVGHGPYRQRSPIPARRIIRFEAVARSGAIVNLRDRLEVGRAGEDARFQLKDPGDYVLVLETDDRAQTHLPSIRFNDYLSAEGLTPALERRHELHRMDADGSERYSRSAKALLHVGAAGLASSDAFMRAVGLALEIVPETNPYGTPRAGTLPIHVIFQGHPLPGALVKLTDLNNDAAPFEMHRTDGQGKATFTMPASGPWLLNVIWTTALAQTEETDFETVFSSLSFDVPPAPR